jgi:decaprenylphospho-beta-D-ribofuranose 2-oxidase
MTVQPLSGWGRVPTSTATVISPESPEDLDLSPIGRGGLPRGLGRSYGDCAQNGGGRVHDMTRINGVRFDPTSGIAIVDGGTSFADILNSIVPQGWFLPVTPGTKHVTVGGAIAADVHGKNHHKEGTIADHVLQFDLLMSDGASRSVLPRSDEFDATCGGLGLTGIVTSATIQMTPIETSKILVDTLRTANLDELMAAMESGDDAYRYSVAWIDLTATGSSTGRGVLTRGDHAPLDALESKAAQNPLAYRSQKPLKVPDVFPSALLNRRTVQAFNEVWYRKAPSNRSAEIQSIDAFFYPLDMLSGWNRLYGRRGFVQYQFAVPDAETETVRQIISDIAEQSFPSFLAVLKRFGPGHGLLSFPIEGWTLALDLPAGIPNLAESLTRFDERVAAVGGRVYLAKDSRLRPNAVREMYPELAEWRAIRNRMDPDGVWQSDLARRLDMI